MTHTTVLENTSFFFPISNFTSLQRAKQSGGVSHEDVKQTMEKYPQPNL